MLEASQVLGFDVDADALNVCRNNIEEFEMASSIDLVNMDIVKEEQAMEYLKRRRVIDTVIMNPPFGTKNNKGMIYLFIIYFSLFKVGLNVVSNWLTNKYQRNKKV